MNNDTWESRNRAKVNKSQRTLRAKHPERYAGYDIKKKYGLTLDKYNEMRFEQTYSCKTCGLDETVLDVRLCVDHLHIEGYEDLPAEEKVKYVRGLLCERCNLILGKAKDEAVILSNLANYLNSYNAPGTR